MTKQFARRMGLYSLPLVVIAGLVLCLTRPDAAETAPGIPENQPVLSAVDVSAIPGISEEEAIQAVLDITGFGNQPEMEVSASQEALSVDRQPPCIKEEGRPVWRISLRNVKVIIRLPASGKSYQKPDHREEGGEEYVLPGLDSFEVLIDKKSGKLVKIYSLPEVESFAFRTEEANLMGASETYLGFPDELPPITLAEAFQSSVEGLPQLTGTPQVEAVCVMYQNSLPPFKRADGTDEPLRKEPGPVWSITLKKVPAPPMHIMPPLTHSDEPITPIKKPKYLDMRHLVNATTGEWMGAGNL